MLITKYCLQGESPLFYTVKKLTKPFSVEDSELRTYFVNPERDYIPFRLLGESGEDELVLIKELQRDQIMTVFPHIDFIQVTRGEDLQTSTIVSSKR